MTTLAERLKELTQEMPRGWQAALARKLGIRPPSIADWVSGRSKSIDGKYLTDVADFFQVSAHWLSTGKGSKVGNVLSALLSNDEKSTSPSLTTILSWEHEDDLPAGEYVFIPRLDIHLSAGNGREQVEMDFVKKQPQAFRADWIRLEKLNPSKLACMKVDGDSMESLLYDGETVVIDTSQTVVKDGKVYALWYDGGERVKRLWKLPGGGLRIKSDNAAHPTIEVSPEHSDTVRILGRVVHKSGTGGL
jgi:phage repressor protein C with HTH and peptisase S24 domain